MRMVTAGRQWAAIIAEVKLGFGTGKGIDVEAKRIEIIRDIVRSAKVNSRCKAGVGANLQKALEHLKWGKTSNRISEGCHRPRLSFSAGSTKVITNRLMSVVALWLSAGK
jgi:hypothetical protein